MPIPSDETPGRPRRPVTPPRGPKKPAAQEHARSRTPSRSKTPPRGPNTPAAQERARSRTQSRSQSPPLMPQPPNYPPPLGHSRYLSRYVTPPTSPETQPDPPPSARSQDAPRSKAPPWIDPKAEPGLVAVKSESAAEREATPAEIGTSLSTDVPEGYGCWDWEDDDAHRHLEMQMAEDFSMPWHTRGPPSPLDGGPLLWKHMPWNSEKNCWGYWCRSQLPKAYTFSNWWSTQALELEARFAREYNIPWALRGPPQGPPANEPRKLWRGRAWRPGSQKWMCRGSTHLAEHDAKFRKAEKKK